MALPVKRLPLGPAFAATQVNATVFRVNSVVSAGLFQYATYYGPDGELVVAQRGRDSDLWEKVTLPARGNVHDGHNGAVLGVSADGIVHVSYDHHGNPLRYRRTAKPHDLHTFGDVLPMTGKLEGRVTYPQFLPAPDGRFYFLYRDGASGNGNLCLNRYDAKKGAWEPEHHPLIDGQNKCNPYWWRPSFGPDGALHLAWCWRDTGDARTNHDICHMVSRDAGKTWQSVAGKPQPLPVNPGNAPVADPVPVGSNLINQCASTVDFDGHPHLAHYQNDADGIPQYIHLWHDGKAWRRDVVSKRTDRFSLSGGGTLRIPISRPEVAVNRRGTVFLVTRDEALGGNIRLYVAKKGDYSRWEPLDLTPRTENLGEWEPTYDPVLWQEKNVLALFVLPVRQGNHETVTDFPPQEAAILEVDLSGL